jgi:hypothetical protein
MPPGVASRRWKTCPFPAGPLLRSAVELHEPRASDEIVRTVAGARVVFADHRLLVHDFPELGTHTAAEREKWLLARAAVVSETQAAGTVANTRIAVAGPQRPARRPPRYGRAVVVETELGLLDVKGAGVATGRTPSLEPHSSGLCTLRELLRETLFQRLVDDIFAERAPDLWTVPVYAVLDLGFDVKTRHGERVPAGALVRRAHRRELDGVDCYANRSRRAHLALEIELMLRRDGVTSANRGTRFGVDRDGERLRFTRAGAALTGLADDELAAFARWLDGEQLPFWCDVINVQFTREDDASPGDRAQLVDFGHFELRSRFELAVALFAHDVPLGWGTTIRPSDPRFVQPLDASRRARERWCVAPAGPDVERTRRGRGPIGWPGRFEPETPAATKRSRGSAASPPAIPPTDRSSGVPARAGRGRRR